MPLVMPYTGVIATVRNTYYCRVYIHVYYYLYTAVCIHNIYYSCIHIYSKGSVKTAIYYSINVYLVCIFTYMYIK